MPVFSELFRPPSTFLYALIFQFCGVAQSKTPLERGTRVEPTGTPPRAPVVRETILPLRRKLSCNNRVAGKPVARGLQPPQKNLIFFSFLKTTSFPLA